MGLGELANQSLIQTITFAGRIRDVCEWLDEVGLRSPPNPVSGSVCYDDPCHLIHAQGVAAGPRRLLAAIEGLEWSEHAEASSCCGAAGTYNLTQPAMSRVVLSRKIDSLEQAGENLLFDFVNARLEAASFGFGGMGCIHALGQAIHRISG